MRIISPFKQIKKIKVTFLLALVLDYSFSTLLCVSFLDSRKLGPGFKSFADFTHFFFFKSLYALNVFYFILYLICCFCVCNLTILRLLRFRIILLNALKSLDNINMYSNIFQLAKRFQR